MRVFSRILVTMAVSLVCAANLCAKTPAAKGLGCQGVVQFCDDWRFVQEDVEGGELPDTDDRKWRLLDIPHDWAFENGYTPDGAQEDKGGYTCGGIGWYRKHFYHDGSLPEDKVVWVDFDAVYMNSEVWINGHYLGKRPYGYISFSYELTPYLKKGDNVLAVRVDNSLEPSARWYHGCGIYGRVSLRMESSLHFVKDGIFVRTKLDEDGAEVVVSYELSRENAGGVVTAYISKDGKKISSVISAKKEGQNLIFKLENPVLWSPETPELYELNISLKNSRGRKTDAEIINFGLRTVEWSAEKGFFLNGKQTKLRGVCEHLEGGPVGAAWTEDMLEWKLKLLKDMGCNAIRTAHNPQVPVFYTLCDRLGIMVMDEAFDGWRQKAVHDYGSQAFEQWWERDLRAMVRRDRNHPCVIIYSVGNETKGGVAAALVRVCHEEDPDRLVTSGHSGSEAMDVLGINGHSEKMKFFEEYVPAKQAFVGTETPHTWQVRGYYRTKTWYRDGYPNKGQSPFWIPDLTPEEIFAYDWISPQKRRNIKQVFNSSYDNATVRLTARHNLQFLRDLDWYSGHFRWTGFDYLGEAGYVHGGWPFRAFMGGVIDLAGFPKDHYYLYQSQWTDAPMLHILPHWTHPDMKEGTEIPVWCYTTGDSVELFLNGKSLGMRRKGSEWNEMQCEWLVPWEKGTLKAVAYENGVEICSKSVSTASSPSYLKVETENLPAAKDADRYTSILSFSLNDEKGTLFPYGDNRIYISDPTNSMEILSFESGNPVDTETNWHADSYRAFFGLARVFLKTKNPPSKHGIFVGAVLGDRSLKTSDSVSICVRRIRLDGKELDSQFSVRYTLDGSEPDLESALYSGAFKVHEGCVVRAKVYNGGNPVMEMQESFGDGSGLYWGVPGEAPCDTKGIQAEYAVLDKAVVKNNNGENVYGGGYVQIRAKGGSISWYQENDGGHADAILKIRYSRQNESSPSSFMKLYNNGELLDTLKFTNTGSQDKDWQYLQIPLRIYSGANNIRLESTDDSAPAIDEIDFLY